MDPNTHERGSSEGSEQVHHVSQGLGLEGRAALHAGLVDT